MGIPERLVEVREKFGYTRKRLADELGRPYRTITKYESGEREPGHSYIVEISKKFGVSTDYLLGASDSMVLSTKKEAPLYSSEALKLARDYDSLDEFGKKVVRAVADVVMTQCEDLTAVDLRPMIRAAARSGGVTEIEEITPDEVSDGEDIP